MGGPPEAMFIKIMFACYKVNVWEVEGYGWRHKHQQYLLLLTSTSCKWEAVQYSKPQQKPADSSLAWQSEAISKWNLALCSAGWSTFLCKVISLCGKGAFQAVQYTRNGGDDQCKIDHDLQVQRSSLGNTMWLHSLVQWLHVTKQVYSVIFQLKHIHSSAS